MKVRQSQGEMNNNNDASKSLATMVTLSASIAMIALMSQAMN